METNNAEELQSAWAVNFQALRALTPTSDDVDLSSVEFQYDKEAPPPKQDTPLSTWVPSVDNVIRADKSGVQMTLKHKEIATFIGVYVVRVLEGVVDVYGATLVPLPGPANIESGPTDSKSEPTMSKSEGKKPKSGPANSESGPTNSESGQSNSKSGPVNSKSGPVNSNSGPAHSESGPTDSESGPTMSKSDGKKPKSGSKKSKSASKKRKPRSKKKKSGPTLSLSSSIVYAPASHALPGIQCLSRSGARILLSSVELEMACLQRICPMFANLWNTKQEGPTLTLESSYLNCSSFAYIRLLKDDLLKRSLQSLSPSPTSEWWTQFLPNTLYDLVGKEQTPTKQFLGYETLVCGPKKSGKSTLCRRITNYLLTLRNEDKVAQYKFVYYLSLDAGSPEFTPHGLMSLVRVAKPILGPPMCHPTDGHFQGGQLLKAHACKWPRAEDDAEHYFACVQDLFRTYQSHVADSPAPVVIDSPGWTTYPSCEIVEGLVKNLEPFMTVYMDTSCRVLGAGLGAGDDAANFVFSSNIKRFVHAYKVKHGHYFEQTGPNRPSYSNRSRPQRAEMQSLSYFHRDTSYKWSSRPLIYQTPLPLPFAGAEASLIGIATTDELPWDMFRWKLVVRRLAALVLIEDDDLADECAASAVPTEKEGLPFVAGATKGLKEELDPTKTRALGMVWIEKIDQEVNTLLVMTPLIHHPSLAPALARRTAAGNPCLVLVTDRFDPPDWAHLESVYEKDWEKKEKKERRAALVAAGGDAAEWALGADGRAERGWDAGDEELAARLRAIDPDWYEGWSEESEEEQVAPYVQRVNAAKGWRGRN